MGENLIALQPGGRPLMRFRENTIHSFNTAAAAGASFVEFDLQVRCNNNTNTTTANCEPSVVGTAALAAHHCICAFVMSLFRPSLVPVFM